MVAHLLSCCGVWLGGAEELLPPDADDNPAGYWENQRFVEINDDLLAHFGGTWMAPPSLPKGWAQRADLEPFRAKARALIAQFDGRPLWGWKDPRTCLTLEFWQDLIPNLAFVVCVREPGSIAHSLAVRRFSNLGRSTALDLWRLYYEAALAGIEGRNAVFCQYATFSYDAPAELKRIVGALGIDVSDEVIAEAANQVQTKLWRNVSISESPDLPADVRSLFYRLSSHCGDVAHQMAADSAFVERIQELKRDRAAEQVHRLESLYVQRSNENNRLRSLLVRLSTEAGKDRAKTVDELLREGRQTQAEGDLGVTADLYYCAHLLSPDDPRPLHQLGIVCSLQGRPRDAADALRQCVVLAPKEPLYRHHYAFALVESGHPEKALEQFELISVAYPQAFAVHYDRANLLLKMLRHEEAAHAYQKCLALQPASAEATLNLGLAFEGLGRYEEARRQYERALKLRPNWDLAHRNLAELECRVA